MSSTFSAGLAASASGSNEPECEPSRSARSIHSAGACSPSTGLQSPVLTMSEPSPQTVSDQMELLPISSAADSLARTSQAPVSSWASQERVALSGSNLPDSLANYDHATSSWKTSQHCLLEGSTPFSETWPRSGMMRSGIAYRLPTLAPRILENESGLLPTPTNQLCPSMMKWAGCRRYAMLTPNAGNSKWRFTWQELGGSGNPYRGTEFGRTKIHPWEWEWMMGYPKDWTALVTSETPSSRKSRKRSGERS